MQSRRINFRLIGWIVLGVALCIAGALWRWTPLSKELDAKALAAALKSIRHQPSAPWLVLGAYVVSSQIMFPITILILATAYAFGPWGGFAYGLFGSVLGAFVRYMFGYWMGNGAYKRVTKSRFDNVADALRRKGLVAVIATHLLPVGPFTVVNLAAGVVRRPVAVCCWLRHWHAAGSVVDDIFRAPARKNIS